MISLGGEIAVDNRVRYVTQRKHLLNNIGGPGGELEGGCVCGTLKIIPIFQQVEHMVIDLHFIWHFICNIVIYYNYIGFMLL